MTLTGDADKGLVDSLASANKPSWQMEFETTIGKLPKALWEISPLSNYTNKYFVLLKVHGMPDSLASPVAIFLEAYEKCPPGMSFSEKRAMAFNEAQLDVLVNVFEDTAGKTLAGKVIDLSLRLLTDTVR